MEAYLHGASTRKVDDLVKALGADTGISKSEVSRICADLDEEVGAFRDRSLAEVAYPYVFLDATYCKARVNRRVVSQAVVIAAGVTADGRREVLGFDVGDSEDGGVSDRVSARPEASHQRGAGRRLVAVVPGALMRNVLAIVDTEGQLRDGRRGDPHIFAQLDAE